MKILHANDQVGTHANSWYKATCDTPTYPKFENDIDVDACIVGAGFTGLSCAITLAQNGLTVAVLDAHRVGWGASGRNGGQIGGGFNLNQNTLEKKFGKSQAQALWHDSHAAVQHVHNLCATHNIECDYAPGIITALHKKRFLPALEQYCHFLEKEYGYTNMQAFTQQELAELLNTDAYFGGIVDSGSGHLHPLKLSVGMAAAAATAGAAIYETSEVTQITNVSSPASSDKKFEVTANGARLSCRKVVIACNGYLDSLNTNVQKRVMPINNFIIATEPLGDLADSLLPKNHAVADTRFVVNYFRLSKDKRMLFGGGENYGYKFPTDITKMVSKPMLKIFPQLAGKRIEYAWGGTLAITQSRLPYVQEVEPGIFSGCGYSGHGVALASYSGHAIAEAITGRTELLSRLSQFPMSRFPGNGMVRSTALALAMTWYTLLDKL